MGKKAKLQPAPGPVVKITPVNYNPVLQDEYSKKFMSLLIEALLKRMQLASTD